MKLNDVKHNHSLTDLLKVLLFSIIMLLPFIDVAVRCGYVMFNKNAYQSYSGQNVENETYESVKVNQLQVGNYVYYTNNQQEQIQRTGTDLYINAHDITLNNVTYNSANIIQYYAYPSSPNSNTLYLVIKENDTTLISKDVMTGNYTCTFYFESYNSNDVNEVYVNGLTFYNITYNDYGNLDNVFEYSINQLENSQLYNWTTQTAIYNGISTMTNQLGITTNIIPIIVCYWFFITIIYIILDIVIRLFTMLTHAIGSKTSS